MIKKLITVVFVIVVFFNIAIIAKAETIPKIYCDDIQSSRDGEFELSVRIADNPGIVSWLIDIDWDESIFEMKEDSFKIGDIFNKGYKFTNSKEAGAFSINWLNLFDVSDDGLMFSVKFVTKEAITPGEYEIKLYCSPQNTINSAEEIVNCVVSNAVVKVIGSSDEDTPKDTEETDETELSKKEDVQNDIESIENDFRKAEIVLNPDSPKLVPIIESEEPIVWISENPKVAKVQDDELIPGLKGKTTITAFSEEGKKIDSFEVVVDSEYTEEKKETQSKFFSLVLIIPVVIVILIFVGIFRKKGDNEGEKI